MSCSKINATEEKRHELSSGTTCKKSAPVAEEKNTLTRCTRKDPSVSTASGPDAAGDITAGRGADEVGGARDEGAGGAGVLELDMGFKNGDDED